MEMSNCRRKLKLLASVVGLVCPLASSAKTTTWTGGATGKAGTAMSFLAEENWDNGVPEPGDTVKIDAATAWDNAVYIGSENGATDTAETFDIGEAGLTFDVASEYTKLLVSFTGSGKIVKTGTGRLGFASDSNHAGGVEVRNGTIAIQKTGLVLGSGAVELSTAYGGAPSLFPELWDSGIKNDVRIRGEASSHKALSSGQKFTFFNPVSAEHDVEFEGKYSEVKFSADVTAVGRTLTVRAHRDKDNFAPDFTFAKKVDANLVKTGNKRLYLNGTTENPDNSLTIREGSCTIGASGHWGGTNIVLESGAVELAVSAVGALSDGACIRIDGDAKVNVAAPYLRVRSLTVGGSPVADGIYYASTLPAAVSGAGGLCVGTAAIPKVWVGGASSLFSDASNWSDGVSPASGDYLVFTNSTAVTLESESVDIGEKGLTIQNAAELQCHVAFTGPGKIVKGGAGRLVLRKETIDSTHSGGTRIVDGVLCLQNRDDTRPRAKGFGTGPVEVVAANGVRPYVECSEWDCALTNSLVFVGENVDGNGAVYVPNYATLGDVTADSDIRLHVQYSTLNVNGPVTAPGKTVTVRVFRPKDDNAATDPSDARVTFAGPVDANVCKLGTRTMELNGVSTNPDSALTVAEGTCRIAAAGAWAGTNVVLNVDNEAGTATLELKGKGNLSPNAVVRVETSARAKVSVAKGVKVAVAELYVDGGRMPSGVYTAANLPGVVSGEGRLKVGDVGSVVIIR